MFVALHYTSPAVSFTDRGTAKVDIPYAVGKEILDVIGRVTEAWRKKVEAEERARHQTKRREEREGKAAASAERKQGRATTVGTGKLYRAIAEAAEAAGTSISKLTVLSPSNDPFRLDTTTGHRNGKWFAEQVARFVGPVGTIHLRGLHYKISSASDVVGPDGKPYINDNVHWERFQEKYAKAAHAGSNMWISSGSATSATRRLSYSCQTSRRTAGGIWRRLSE